MKLVNYFPTRRSYAPSVFDSFEELFNDFPTLFKGNMATTPAVNICELDNEFKLEVAAPGIDKNDFEVNVDDNQLTISANKQQTHEEEGNGNYTRREFSFVPFSRSFTLPDSVDASSIKANYENGLLQVSLPKKPEAQPQPVRTIKVG